MLEPHHMHHCHYHVLFSRPGGGTPALLVHAFLRSLRGLYSAHFRHLTWITILLYLAGKHTGMALVGVLPHHHIAENPLMIVAYTHAFHAR